MKKVTIVAGILLFVLFGTEAFASEVPKALDATGVSNNISAFAGDVVITFEKGEDVTINAAKMVRNEDEFVLKGNVEIKFNNLVFHSEKAAVLTSDDTVLIKMKSCEITNS